MRQNVVKGEIMRLNTTTLAPTDELNALLRESGSTEVTTGIKLADLLRRPELTYEMLAPVDKERKPLPRAIKTTVEIQVKYEGYIKRELLEAARQKRLEEKPLSPTIDYRAILGLRLEAAEKLEIIKPTSIGQASRISGVNPADIAVLLIYLESKKGEK